MINDHIFVRFNIIIAFRMAAFSYKCLLKTVAMLILFVVMCSVYVGCYFRFCYITQYNFFFN